MANSKGRRSSAPSKQQKRKPVKLEANTPCWQMIHAQSEEWAALSLYSELSRWEKNAVFLIMQSIAWGNMTPKTDKKDWQQIADMVGLGALRPNIDFHMAQHKWNEERQRKWVEAHHG